MYEVPKLDRKSARTILQNSLLNGIPKSSPKISPKSGTKTGPKIGPSLLNCHPVSLHPDGLVGRAIEQDVDRVVQDLEDVHGARHLHGRSLMEVGRVLDHGSAKGGTFLPGVIFRVAPVLLGHYVHVDDVARNREGEVTCHDEHKDSPVGGFSPEKCVPETIMALLVYRGTG